MRRGEPINSKTGLASRFYKVTAQRAYLSVAAGSLTSTLVRIQG